MVWHLELDRIKKSFIVLPPLPDEADDQGKTGLVDGEQMDEDGVEVTRRRKKEEAKRERRRMERELAEQELARQKLDLPECWKYVPFIVLPPSH